ncbi:Uncharacterised protein [Mycobacteroides abscessus subsp. abscessus]|nr:Uncharacterised protein [Mycobacteroides abscessus subsp. abscessus]
MTMCSPACDFQCCEPIVTEDLEHCKTGWGSQYYEAQQREVTRTRRLAWERYMAENDPPEVGSAR